MCPRLILPRTVPSERGLTVEGASPELLSELLTEYGTILKRTSPQIWESSLPGLPREQIIDGLGSAGLPPSEELIAWWTWRNGHAPGTPHGLRNPQLSLRAALSLRSDDEDTAYEMLPSQSWLRVAGEGLKRSIGVSCEEDLNPPSVRSIAPEFDRQHGRVTHGQAVSLCTFVAWQLVAIEEGWNRYDPESGFWKLENWEGIPLEWRLTGIV